jgi:hypothetical protein
MSSTGAQVGAARLLLAHPLDGQHQSGASRRSNDRRYKPAGERKHSDVIINERAGNADKCTRDDAAGRSGELRASQDGPASRSKRMPATMPIARTRRDITIGAVVRIAQILRTE